MPKETNKMKLYPKTIKEGDQEKIASLLSKRADIDSVDEMGKTALWWAAFHGKLELVDFLLEKEADPNISDHKGQTPLDVATQLALGGHREPGEDNPYSQIVTKLKPLTKDVYQTGIIGITEKMENLGIHATKVSTQGSGASGRHIEKTPEPEQSKDEICTIL